MIENVRVFSKELNIFLIEVWYLHERILLHVPMKIGSDRFHSVFIV